MQAIQFPTQIDGHQRCVNSGCDTQVPLHVAYLTKGLCFQCFLDGPAGQIHQIEVLHRAQRIPVKIHEVGKKRKNRTAAVKARNHVVARAKADALKRLRMLYPDMYDLLYDEERHKAGLLPLPHRDQDRYERIIKTYLDMTGYDPAQTVGVPPHGA